MKSYCPVCEKEVESRVKKKEETLNVKGQSITLNVKVRFCAECGEELIDSQLDNDTIKVFYDEYKRRNNLLTSEEVKKIRNGWKLSQANFAVLLGMGEKTITRYENGGIQDQAHDNLIRLAADYQSFKRIWDLRKHLLPQEVQNQVMFDTMILDSIKIDTPYTLETCDYIYDDYANLFNTGRKKHARAEYGA